VHELEPTLIITRSGIVSFIRLHVSACRD